jgi:hypothetical protein
LASAGIGHSGAGEQLAISNWPKQNQPQSG